MPSLHNKMQTKQTVVNQPWDQAQPFITQGMEGAQGLLESGAGFNPYQGQMVAGFSDQTEQALQNTAARATGANTLMDAAGQAATAYARGDYRDSGSPEFNAALNYQAGQMADDVNRGFSLGGRYGSGAHVGVLGNEVGQFRNQALAAEQARQQGLQMQAIGMAPQISAGQFIGDQALLNAGMLRDDLAQRQIDADMERFNVGQMADWNRLNAYNQVVGPYATVGGTQQVQERRGAPFMRFLGGALMTGLGAL